jgi:hypothetical protein
VVGVGGWDLNGDWVGVVGDWVGKSEVNATGTGGVGVGVDQSRQALWAEG